MQKTIILGTDLHGEPTELASKTVNNLRRKIDNYQIISIQNRKPFKKQEHISIIPKLTKINSIRKLVQSIILPIKLALCRLSGYNQILSFWSTNSSYHKYLFKFLNFLRYKIKFVVITEQINLSVLAECEQIICQSERMKSYLLKSFPESKISLVYPSVNLSLFKPSKKINPLLIPSVPYDVKDFKERGIDLILEFIKKNKISSKIIFRSDESYNYVKSLNLENSELINKTLDNKELSKIMSQSCVIPLIYTKNAPDMPYSAIEGMASGCAIVCSDKMGISGIIKKENAGIVIEDISQLENAIKSAIKSKTFQKNARKTAEKYFNENNLKTLV